MSNECHFPAIIGMNENVVVSPSDINLHEILGRAEFIEERGNKRKRIGILDRFGVKRMIILTRTKFSVFLSNKEKSTCLR